MAPRTPDSRARSRRKWNWLLVIPALALFFPGLYARSTPQLLGFPFFYWYQCAWILLTAILSAFVYFIVPE